jgi:hypothetical protein
VQQRIFHYVHAAIRVFSDPRVKRLVRPERELASVFTGDFGAVYQHVLLGFDTVKPNDRAV